MVNTHYEGLEGSLITLLGETIKKRWKHSAFSDYGTEVHYTYKEVFEQVTKMHIMLEEYGIKPGDKVALCDKNSSNWAVTFLALYTYRTVVVPLLADFNIRQIENIVSHSDSKILFTNADVFGKAEFNIPAVDVKTFKPFADEEMAAKVEQVFGERYPKGVKESDVKFEPEDSMESLAVISYTSGSTGSPKGVMLPHRAIWANNVYARDTFPLFPDNKCISLLPLAHMFGMAFEYLFPLSVGCHIQFLTRIPSPRIVLKAFEEVRPRLIISVPLVIEKIIQGKVFPTLRTRKMKMLLAIPGVRDLIYRKVRHQMVKAFGGRFHEVILGGAGVSPEVDQFLHKIKFPYCIGYGMTECAPLICYSDWKTFVSGSCGRSVARMDIEILSDDPENVPGEIIVRGANLMVGYYKNDEATAETIDKEGWLHTGDLGTMDRQGNLFIRGRKKNMLLGANGQNIYPEEVEDLLTRQPLIDETVVVQRDQKLVALVYVSDNTLKEQNVFREELEDKAEELKRTVNAILPKFAQITAIEFRDEEFEKTPKRSIKRFLYK